MMQGETPQNYYSSAIQPSLNHIHSMWKYTISDIKTQSQLQFMQLAPLFPNYSNLLNPNIKSKSKMLYVSRLSTMYPIHSCMKMKSYSNERCV